MTISQKADIGFKVTGILVHHMFNRKIEENDHFDPFGNYGFYADRLKMAPFYGLVQGREIIKMVCRCAFNDSLLTENEAIVIMETCLDPRLDNILMEVNFNAEW